MNYKKIKMFCSKLKQYSAIPYYFIIILTNNLFHGRCRITAYKIGIEAHHNYTIV